jgi:hypothetical protein
MGMSGRELLVYRPDLFVDDEDVLDIVAFKQQMGESNGIYQLSIEIKTTHSHNKHVKVNQTYE